ncbi:DUF3237 family protein [Leucobacter massiliensis]|nr:DUF3237 family protein [Leucobacter massiliensis]
MHAPAAAPAAPALEHACTIVAEVAPGLPVERRGADMLEIIPITGGTVTGRISGRVEPGGADWCRERADGAYEVEARYWFRTDSGSVVDVVNVGRIAPGAPGERHGLFMSTPQFRTLDPELQWLTQRVFVGRAEAFGTHTTIDVFEVVS